MNTPHTPGNWAWQKFGKQWCLTGQHGMRPIVLSVMKGELTSLVDGRLVALDPDHPDAQLIASAPTLLSQRDDAYSLIEQFGRTVTDMFEQMERGDWQDNHGHSVTLNTAMIALKKPVLDAIALRATLKA